jgi:hypothetical protein
MPTGPGNEGCRCRRSAIAAAGSDQGCHGPIGRRICSPPAWRAHPGDHGGRQHGRGSSLALARLDDDSTSPAAGGGHTADTVPVSTHWLPHALYASRTSLSAAQRLPYAPDLDAPAGLGGGSSPAHGRLLQLHTVVCFEVHVACTDFGKRGSEGSRGICAKDDFRGFAVQQLPGPPCNRDQTHRLQVMDLLQIRFVYSWQCRQPSADPPAPLDARPPQRNWTKRSFLLRTRRRMHTP